jgi:protein TonB
MFDLTVGTLDRPFRDQHGSGMTFSVLTHLAIVGAVTWTVMFAVSERLPEVPAMMAFVAEMPAATPPPPPPPPTRLAKTTESAARATNTAATFAAPSEVPVGIQPEALADFDGEGGEVGGVEGGLPGGVLGGTPGGLVTDVAPPPLPPPAPKVVRVGGDVKAPALIHRVEPEYPLIAVNGKVTGLVILEATVSEQGVVTDVRVLRSVVLLEDAAIKAVKQWRYQPLVLNGEASPFILVVTLTFSLR